MDENPYRPAGQASAESAPNESIFQDQSFWGLALAQFLGAFNDNLFKQLILLLSVPTAAAIAAAEQQGQVAGSDVQGWATAVFSLPFVLMSGFAGFLSDKYSKQFVIFCAKCAEIGIMFLGMLAFLYYDTFGMIGTWSVLFLMGTHSTFFGPGKYGILPELFKEKDLPRANGLILMSTFLAIIFGTVIAGKLGDYLLQTDAHQGNAAVAVDKPQGDAKATEASVNEVKAVSAKPLWVGSMVGVGIAIVGMIMCMRIRKVPPATPNAKLKTEDLGISQDIRSLLWRDRPLFSALLVSCVFWLVSGIAVPTVNRLGLTQLSVDKTQTSILVAAIGLGIMVGAIFAGLFLKKVSPRHQVTSGLICIILTLVVLGAWTGGGKQFVGYYGSLAVLIILGAGAAVYAIPLQVFLQQRPPASMKGRMIATMNQANFVGILIAGPLYQVFEGISRSMGWPICSIFWMMALLVLPIPFIYRLGESKFEETVPAVDA